MGDIKGINYIGPVDDFSGYGEASRNYILSLHRKGVPIKVTPHNFDSVQVPVLNSDNAKILAKLKDNPVDYNVVVAQLTPDMAVNHYQKGKFNISYFAWETTQVPPFWVDCLNNMDAVVVPCQWNVEAAKSSGVKKPVVKVPHGIDINKFDNVDSSNVKLPVDDNTFMFYSIFQWNPRKNPVSLIRSYYNAFRNKEDVVLVLKTFISGGGSADFSALKEKIHLIKRDMGLSNYPRIILVTDILSDEKVKALHKRGDCYISMSHSEGWGLGCFEAGLAETPVIATGMGGHVEFLTEDNSYLIDYVDTYVEGMSVFNKWYLGSGMWAYPLETHAVSLMRHVFNNRQEAKDKAIKLSKSIKANFSWERVSDLMLDRIEGVLG